MTFRCLALLLSLLPVTVSANDITDAGIQVEVVGVTALPREEIERLVAATNRGPVQAEHIVTLAQKINLLYRQAGLITSGVKIPTTVTGGKVVLQAVEGELSHINITTNGRLREAYLRHRLLRWRDSGLTYRRRLTVRPGL